MSLLTPVWIEAGPNNAKTTLVFLHGIGGGKKGFQSSVDFFAKQGFRALAWDMPGYGDSPLDGTLSFESLAASLEDMLDAAKIEKAVLVGHSMGGKTAMALALTSPASVGNLVVVDIAPVAYADRFTPYVEAMRSIDAAATASHGSVSPGGALDGGLSAVSLTMTAMKCSISSVLPAAASETAMLSRP